MTIMPQVEGALLDAIRRDQQGGNGRQRVARRATLALVAAAFVGSSVAVAVGFGRMFAARSAMARSHQFRRRPFGRWEGQPRSPWRSFVGKSSWSPSGRRGAPRASSRSLSWPRSIENCALRTPALSYSSRHTVRSQKRGEWYGGIASLCRSCLRTQRNPRAARSTGRSSVASRRFLSRS